MRSAYPLPACALLIVFGISAALSQPATPRPPALDPTLERLSENTYRLERILIDRANGQIRIPGTVNSATVLEYLANARGGFKAYESALELETSAEFFNVALLMIGLQRANGVPSRYKFDPEAPRGDAVEIWVEWEQAGETRRVRAEELVYDNEKQRSLAGGWVYTGSVVLEDGTYLAGRDGVLIGFMHTPESIIDSAAALESGYGDFRINPALGLPPGAPVTVVLGAAERGGP